MKNHSPAARIICLILAMLCALTAMASAEVTTYDIVYSSANPIPEIAANVRPAVVEVVVYDETWDPVTRIASVDVLGGGSGCYIRAGKEGGYVLTNYHVVQDVDLVSLLWLDGTEMDCEVLAIFPVGAHQYIAMLPLDDDASDIFLYRFVPVGTEEFNLEGIEDDDEYEAVVDVFDMLLDYAEFDAMVGDED